MNGMNFNGWSMQPAGYTLPFQEIELCSPPSATDDQISPQKETQAKNSKKMAIPRLPEGSEASLSSIGRFHRRHVRRACESCRQRKTKCTGDKSGCRNCREAGIICCYTDGKREKSKRQLATLSAKVQTYEEVIRKMSSRFGVSDEQLMSNAMICDSHHSVLGEQSEMASAFSRGRSLFNSDNPERKSRSPSPLSLAGTDRVEEDFNRDDSSRATGYIGNSSEVSWLQNLRKKVNGDSQETGQSSPPATPGAKDDTLVSSSNFYEDTSDVVITEDVQSHAMPGQKIAELLLRAYFKSVHPSFPIIGMSTFISQYQLFFSHPNIKPGNKWLAILNLIFGIAAVYAHLISADWKSDLEDHSIYFSRARALSMPDSFLDHPDLQQLQIGGLTSFYLLTTGQINRSWKMSGIAVRSAIALGLHLRNVDIKTSDTSKEIRYRVWWALYTMDHVLNVITGRPSCIIDGACTTPIPIPYDESDFPKQEAAQMLSNHSRKGIWVHEWNSASSNLPSPSQAEDSSTDGTGTKPDKTMVDWLKSLPSSMSLYFFHLATLTSIGKRANMKLYSAEAVQAPWPSLEFTIQSLTLETNAWLSHLPESYDFNLLCTTQTMVTQKTSLAFSYYSTRISITRPCLCRLEKQCQADGTYEFCFKAAADCIEAATQIISLLPDNLDASLLHKISPWWSLLHYIMQATTVLLLELSFRVEHVPEKAGEISQATKKSVKWLHKLSCCSTPAHRAWKLCDEFLRGLAQPLNLDISDLPGDDILIDPVDNFASVLESSLLDQQIPTPMPYLEPEAFDFLDKQQTHSQSQSFMPKDGLDDYLPYDPNTGQITGSFFPTNNIDLDLSYVLDSSVY
ncbi:fungal-specific transcription factor domain-containing protein [Talaromyces proteolyticus]|uniref:Fungal-specific transcription factor domain-containing protein n=1 Tax=Talaromyces proteolyticus TaxID=1131652 RepID=A0AAD4KTP5_9EURO|nr:fungal-specific transcription factor domain-containing protein [Talaromyces proteolyticus]KAH8699062.1 fungal-specific transcription factor domain-containing protein [Talaromyces proteolyticus]